MNHVGVDPSLIFSSLSSENEFFCSNKRDRNCSGVKTAFSAKALRVSIQSDCNTHPSVVTECLYELTLSATCGFALAPLIRMSAYSPFPLPACLIISLYSLGDCFLRGRINDSYPPCTRLASFAPLTLHSITKFNKVVSLIFYEVTAMLPYFEWCEEQIICVIVIVRAWQVLRRITICVYERNDRIRFFPSSAYYVVSSRFSTHRI